MKKGPAIGRRGALAAALALPALRIPEARAQAAYPDHTVRIINPFPPGSPFDLLARLAADRLDRELGKPVVVESRSGAGGTIGTGLVARSPADGYTLLVHSTSMLSTSSFLYRALPYDMARDLVPVWGVLTSGFVLITRPSLSATTLAEFIALARAEPGRVTFGSAGKGTTHHLSGELFMRLTGTQLTHAPYRGAVPAETDLMAGHIDCIFDSISGVAPMIVEGKVRALAVLREARSRLLPEVLTAREAGLEGFTLPTGAIGLYAPAGVPTEIRERIASTLIQVTRTDTDMQARLASAGMNEGILTGEEYSARLLQERDFYAGLIRQAGIEPE